MSVSVSFSGPSVPMAFHNQVKVSLNSEGLTPNLAQLTLASSTSYRISISLQDAELYVFSAVSRAKNTLLFKYGKT